MTERRFQVARRLIRSKPWDFFMMVEMGLDRLHHCFWQFYDPQHPLYEPGNRYETAFHDYYRFLDQRSARCSRCSRGRRHIDVDHGAVRHGRPVLQRPADPENY
jgi:predicted AlkP superfamily phosphohydrolase/phosphomutase